MEPIVLEAILWICLILGSPAIYWAFSTLAQIVAKLVLPGKIVEISYENDSGHVVTSRLCLDDDDELVRVLLQVGKKSGVNNE